MVGINSDQPAVAILTKILLQLTDSLAFNYDGLLRDLDREYLHDYRIALRKIRILLSEFKGVFAAQQRQYFRTQWSHWGRISNRLRDLDVYLLQEDQFRSLLSATLAPGLDALFTAVRHQRRQELASVRRALKSSDYQAFSTAWQAFLTEQYRTALGPDANEPIRALVNRRLRKCSKRIMALGEKISKKPTPAKLHRLRLRCKKFRYLIEFFKTFYPPKEINIIIGQLKQLQDKMGRFNDLSNQLRELQQQRMGLQKTKGVHQTTEEAIAALAIQLSKRQKHALATTLVVLRRLLRRKNRALYNQLFT